MAGPHRRQPFPVQLNRHHHHTATTATTAPAWACPRFKYPLIIDVPQVDLDSELWKALADGRALCKMFMTPKKGCLQPDKCRNAHVAFAERPVCWSWDHYGVCAREHEEGAPPCW